MQSVYDEIAEQWHGTRYRAWPRVEEFVRALPPSSLVADLGCGNGKMAAACRAGATTPSAATFPPASCGSPRCSKKLDAQVADVMALPYRAGAFDAALSIAVLHHVSSEPRRALLVAETLRVLRPGGVALFYAWAQEQHAGRSGHRFERQDVFVAWHQRDGATGAAGDVLQRYCHVYCEGEPARAGGDAGLPRGRRVLRHGQLVRRRREGGDSVGQALKSWLYKAVMYGSSTHSTIHL